MEHDQTPSSAVAVRLTGTLDHEGLPQPSQWQTSRPLRFSADWQGKHADAERATEVRLLWTPETLFLKFVANFRTITVFSDSEPGGRRDHLWDGDVVEAFLQPDDSDIWRYKEFEVSPNGMWIDLDVSHGAISDLRSGLTRRVNLDQVGKVWTAELAVPMKALTPAFDPALRWRVNFFRIEGAAEPRFYSAWRPTNTPAPSFHVPEAFAPLTFEYEVST